jgi:hypothetical protein
VPRFAWTGSAARGLGATIEQPPEEKKIVRRSGKKPSGKKPANTDADQH